jgi:membrane-associated phospholipid phosphatase
MTSTTRGIRLLYPLGAFAALAACTDLPVQPRATLTPQTARRDVVEFWEAGASTRWNDRAAQLLALRPPPNGQAAASRIHTYLTLAQYRAVLAAESNKDGSMHPSIAAAVSAASAKILSSFFGADIPTIQAYLASDLAAPGWPGERHRDLAAGVALGTQVGTAMLAQAATDNYLVVPTGSPPAGPGFWIQNGAVVRSLHGARPFFMTSASQLRSPPPPAFGSPAFLDALAEIRQISDTRTPEQTALAIYWATGAGPFTASSLNIIANQMIRAHHRTEREAARILAYANVAAFDAQIACWDSKLFYWTIRPSQADPQIALPTSLPNHPSYPSGHSCITGAMMAVLIDAFPGERETLEQIITEAGLSRMYAGLHYRFDVTAGQDIGRGAAALALAGSLE